MTNRPLSKVLLAACCAALTLHASPMTAEEGSADPELVIQIGVTSVIDSVAVSPDGKFVAAGGGEMAAVWDFDTGDIIRRFQAGGDTMLATPLVISPDGKLMAVAGNEWDPPGPPVIRVFDFSTGKLIRKLRGTAHGISALAFTPDSKGIVSVGGSLVKEKVSGPIPWKYFCHGCVARLWDISTGEQVRVFSGHDRPLNSVAVSPDGRFLATASRKALWLWDLDTGRVVRRFDGAQDEIKSLVFSPDSAILVTGEQGTGEKPGMSRIWDVASGRQVKTVKHPEDVESIAISPDGRMFAASGARFTGKKSVTKLWSLPSGRKKADLKTSPETVECSVFTPDGRFLLECAGNHIRVWDIEKRKLVRKLQGHAEATKAAAFSPDGALLAVGTGIDSARLWDLNMGREVRTLKHQDPVEAIAFSPDGRRLASGGYGSEVRLWDAATGRRMASLKGHSGRIRAVAWSRDGRYVASGAWDKTVRIWSSRGRKLERFSYKNASFLGFVDDKRLLAVGGEEGMGVWDWRKGRLVRELSGKDNITAADMTPDGSLIAASWTGVGVRVWDSATGRVVHDLSGPQGDSYAMAFSPDKKLIAASDTRTSVIHVWRLSDGKLAHILKGYEEFVSDLAFSPDGKLLASTGWDGAARLWRVADGKELCRLISLDEGWVAVTPGGQFDGSTEGLMSVRWTVGLRSFPLDAFSEAYYEPRLIPRLLAGEALSSAKPKLAEGFAVPPKVRIVSPSDGAAVSSESVEVKVAAEDQGGGVDEIRLFHNGKAVGGESRGIKVVARAGTTQRAFRVTLTSGENRFRAVGLSRDRIESAPAEAVVIFKGASREAELHILTVGINRYRNPALNLNYAEPDARALGAFFEEAPGRLFKSVRRQELYDKAATKDAILSGLDALKTTSPQDVVVIYLAGHGDSSKGRWFFVPYELVYPDKEEDLREKSVSSNDLQERIAAIGARKVVLLLDACKSGSALLAFALRGFEEQKALRQLARASGVHVIAASGKDQFAAEVKELGHGVFTYTLLEALRGSADGSPKDGVVNVRELLSYVEKTLPDISEKHRSEPQFPVVDSRGMDFPLTAVK